MGNNVLESEIIAAAKEVFISKGYENTNMSDIAAKVGITRPSLHYYFRTKEKMFQAVASSILEGFIPQVSDAVNADLPFFEKLEKLIDCYISVYENNPELLYFIINESRSGLDRLLQFIDREQLSSYVQSIIGMIKAEMEAGNIRQIPVQYLLISLLSQIIFPFLAKPVMEKFIFNSSHEFRNFIDDWKTHLLDTLTHTLSLK